MTGYEKPVLIQTFKTPREIVGFNNMETFTDYIRMCEMSSKSGFPPSRKEMSEFGKEVLAAIASVLEELRANGYHPNGIGSNGQVQFEIVLKSDLQVLYEQGLEEMPKYTNEQIMEMARREQIPNVIRNIPSVSSAQINAEKYR